MFDSRSSLSLGSSSRLASWIAWFAVLLALAACGGGGGGSSLANSSLAAADGDSGEVAIAVVVRGAGELHAYREFAALVAELERQLAAGNLLRRIAAHGRYNAGTVELTASRAGFEFIAP